MSVVDRLIDPFGFPPFSELTPEQIGLAVETAISDHQAVVAKIVADRPTTFETAWLPLEQATNKIDALWSAVSHVHSVASTPELREAFASGQRRIVENRMAFAQNRALSDVLVALASAAQFDDLPLQDRVAVERAIKNFSLSGVTLDDESRKRFKEVSIELSNLSNDFMTAVLDATDAWQEHILDEGQLAGLSDADKAMLAANARAKGLDGWVVSLQQPSVTAILTFAENRALRERVYTAFGTRASDQGPNAGQFDNSARINHILALRREAANLLGFRDPVALSLATKMANDPNEVISFLRRLAGHAKPAAQVELAQLKKFASDELDILDLQPWDVGYATNRLKLARHSIDAQQIKLYFPIDKVLDGWSSLLNRLFGITIVERDNIDLWHPDARYFDIFDGEESRPIAGLYLDLHARSGKKGGAWASSARPLTRDGAKIQVPVAYMVCNFASIDGELPPLLTHDDVRTLLHETGHCLHHVFSLIERPSISGFSGFEWDAVELPSQLLEDFSWDYDVLAAMSGHRETGEALPEALFRKMEDARRFQTGLFLIRQIEFALFDIFLHLEPAEVNPLTVLQAVRDEVSVLHPPKWHRFPQSFSHIFAGSYASGYYSYLWADVLAADGFQRFVEKGLVDRDTGGLLRNAILSRGASRPALESFIAFRGREPSPTAVLKRYGLEAVLTQ